MIIDYIPIVKVWDVYNHILSLFMFRLSQTAGDKLRENNPNFSDLSDPYRPTKLSEMFSELYDNQWTDAMEILEADRQEKRAVETLLNILMV